MGHRRASWFIQPGGTAMRFRDVRSALVIIGILAVSPATLSAQGPAASPAFDGKYIGTATLTRGGGGTTACSTINSVDMTITGGQVVLNENHFNFGRLTYRGSVGAAGEVSVSRQTSRSLFTVSGTIHDNVFTGNRVGGTWGCYYKYEMAKG
jgi:hypothetical protein